MKSHLSCANSRISCFEILCKQLILFLLEWRNVILSLGFWFRLFWNALPIWTLCRASFTEKALLQKIQGNAFVLNNNLIAVWKVISRKQRHQSLEFGFHNVNRNQTASRLPALIDVKLLSGQELARSGSRGPTCMLRVERVSWCGPRSVWKGLSDFSPLFYPLSWKHHPWANSVVTLPDSEACGVMLTVEARGSTYEILHKHDLILRETKQTGCPSAQLTCEGFSIAFLLLSWLSLSLSRLLLYSWKFC